MTIRLVAVPFDLVDDEELDFAAARWRELLADLDATRDDHDALYLLILEGVRDALDGELDARISARLEGRFEDARADDAQDDTDDAE